MTATIPDRKFEVRKAPVAAAATTATIQVVVTPEEVIPAAVVIPEGEVIREEAILVEAILVAVIPVVVEVAEEIPVRTSKIIPRWSRFFAFRVRSLST
jgi:hypothetical protein